MKEGIVLNRGCGGFPYEVRLNIRVDGKDLSEAVESVVEYLQDHCEEVFVPMYPEKMEYPTS